MIRSYIRVSTAGQDTDGFGIDAQIAAVDKFCLSEFGGEMIAFYVDRGISGTVPIEEREAGSLLIADAKPGDTVLSFSVSRISRMVWISSKFLYDMKEKDIRVVCLDAQDASKGPSGAFMFHILAAVSQQDRENILKITAAGREEKRKTGGDLGGKPKPWQSRTENGLQDDPKKIAMLACIKKELERKTGYDRIISIVHEEWGVKVSKPAISTWKKDLINPESEMVEKIFAFTSETT